MTIRDYFLEGIKKAGTAYKLADNLGRSGAYITQVRLGGTHPSDETIIRLARYLEIDEGKLVLINLEEKATDSTRPILQNIIKRYGSAAALLLILSLTGTGFAAPSPTDRSVINIHYRTLNRYKRFFFPLIFSEECAI